MTETCELFARADGAPLRVFLIEDSPEIRELIIEDFASIPGVELAGTAETESDALAQLACRECDVLILDIQLKQGNGINLLRTLAGNPAQTNCLKVVLSNHAGGTYRRMSEQYGVKYFFDKTSQFPQLHELLQNLSKASPPAAAHLV